MAVFKCKMCGGDLEIGEGNVAVCEYCGTKQTVPTLDNERKESLFGRAGRLLRACEFDKASVVFGDIVSEFPDEAEAYWGLLLCKYGVEYVDDPATGKKIPTCHRLSFNSVMEDADFEQALENADYAARGVYREEAKFLEELRRNVIEVSAKEEPYDVFICYKETDESGRRTVDSAIANDIYYQLTQEGLKVFYAAITLEDKLGQEYEPYIFAALNSAKVMLAIGTKPEYFEAVWVKNEWSRFMKLMKTDRSKLLIPCYKDMDAYDLPEEFAHLQAQDMGKIGFINDVVRGIRKVLAPVKAEAAPAAVKTAVSFGNEPNTTQLLRRAFMFLEDEEWESADEYCEKVLDFDVENAEAYLGKLLAELRIPGRDELLNAAEPFDGNNLYKKILRFGSEKLCAELEEANKAIRERKEENRRNGIYTSACNMMKYLKTEKDLRKAAEFFGDITGYRDADENRILCLCKAEEARKQAIYDDACSFEEKKTIKDYENAILRFEKIRDFRDSEKREAFCRGEIERFEAEAEKARIEKERKAEEQRKAAEIRKQRNKKLAAVFVSAVAVVAAAAILFVTVVQPMMNYNAAVALFEEEKFEEAIAAFEAMDGYKDSAEQIENCKEGISEREYQKAVAIMEEGRYEEAIVAFKALGEYKDAANKAGDIRLQKIKDQLKNIKVGSHINFGVYEQDNNTSNGKEDVEWLVLEVKDGKALVISKYALDCKQYNTSYTNVTWETCTLRKWLNNDFINAAFSADEKAMIPTVTVSVDKNPDYSTNSGNATQDQVFLLSITEANKYFSSDSARKCEPTDYAVANGAYVYSGNGNCWWWLRSPGYSRDRTANVGLGGDVVESGYVVDRGNNAVRPALWIDLSSIE